jgi:hypothetical protein
MASLLPSASTSLRKLRENLVGFPLVVDIVRHLPEFCVQ